MRWFPIIGMICLLGMGLKRPIFCQETAGIERFALLIGIDQYASLSPAEQLEGSQNDVELMHGVLTSRFDFAEENIIQLLNQQASASAIRAAFQQLVQRVKQLPADKQAQVYFHFSGHGSQVADQEVGHPDRDEEDGLDETLVPYDADRQGGQGDIRDDEINDLINQVVGEPGHERANFILVYDCCHSGSGARGDTKVRQLRRDMPLASTVESVTRKLLPPGVVFLSACHETEVEPEFREDGKAFGLLTRFLSQILVEQNEMSSMSYDILHDALRSRYQQDSRVVQAPHPQLEASDFDTRRMPVLGATSAIDRPASFQLVAAAGSTAVLRAGQLHGLTPGAILEIYADPEKLAENTSDGFIRVQKAEKFQSEVEFVNYDEKTQSYSAAAQTDSLPSGLAILRVQGPADNLTKLKILVDEVDSEPSMLSLDSPRLPSALAQQLRELSAEGDAQRIVVVSSPTEETNLILRLHGESSTLFPSTGNPLIENDASSKTPQSLRGGWGLFDAQGVDSEGVRLADFIERITRANRLVSFAAQGQNAQPEFQVEFELLRVETDEAGNITSIAEIEKTSDKRIVLEVGMDYAVRFRNSRDSKQAAYFTALEVTPDMGIQVVAPYMEKDIKLEPGGEYLCAPFVCDKPGTLHEILFATTDPHDFSFIEQKELPRTRGSSSNGNPDGLQDQLVSSLFPNLAQSRGRRIREKSADVGWYSTVIEWEVMPAALASRTRGAPGKMAAPYAAVNPVQPTVGIPNDDGGNKSLTTEATDKGYELVTVFYGTDREAIHSGKGIAEKAIPLIPGLCLAASILLAVLTWMKATKLRIAGLAVCVILTSFLSLQYMTSMRNRDIALERAGVQYGRGRGELEVGRCEVSIPKDHRLGFIESPSILSLEFREDPTRHVILDKITPEEDDEFYRNLNAVIEKSPKKEAIVFVHGFNNSFEDAARRTGQMAYDLKYQGAPIFFSWPSQAELAAYTIDENNVTWAVPHLKTFLQDIRKKTNIQSLNLIAHSMGNRAVTNVLKELYLEFKDDAKIFNQVILAAPDVDAEVFKKDIAPAIVGTATQVTLYASSKDRALLASKNVHGYPRAGESGENLVITDGIYTIDVTDIDSSLLGHNYFGDSDSIVSDMYHLLRSGDPPGMRPSLKESVLHTFKYWIFLKTKF